VGLYNDGSWIRQQTYSKYGWAIQYAEKELEDAGLRESGAYRNLEAEALRVQQVLDSLPDTIGHKSSPLLPHDLAVHYADTLRDALSSMMLLLAAGVDRENETYQRLWGRFSDCTRYLLTGTTT
jgi:hypothetical protein